MPRGGLSKDPETRKRQLQALEHGREIARERRAAGLPTKRTETAAGSVPRGRYATGKEGGTDAGDSRGQQARRRPQSRRQPETAETFAGDGTGERVGIGRRIAGLFYGVGLDAWDEPADDGDDAADD